jgi:uncharacterized repeat protein (TIGR01451 family)
MRCSLSRFFSFGLLFLLSLGIWVRTGHTQELPPTPVFGSSSEFGVSPPLRSIKPAPFQFNTGIELEIPIFRFFRKPENQQTIGSPAGPAVDSVVQSSLSTSNIPTPTRTFEGISSNNNLAIYGFRVLPPDTNGDVGPNHYVQIVNLLFRVFDKSTGTALTSASKISSLFAGAGLTGPCATTDQGDPTVLYDHLADRWLISQFAFNTDIFGNPVPPFFQCIAISQTGDPTGSYFVYAFQTPNNFFNDYTKFGVWPDAYYMTYNQFNGNSFAGVGAFAFDRASMLAGKPKPIFIYFDLGSSPTTSDLGSMLPSDLDGSPPPAGTPNYFVVLTAPEFGDPSDALRVFEFHADFSNPANSTFTERSESPIATAPFDPNLCNFSTSCIPQPSTRRNQQRIDALSDRLMYRLQYRNFVTSCPIDSNLTSCGGLVVNHTVNVGSNRAGIRWYILEVNNSKNTISIDQQGTYAPADSNHRWMGSAAMDKDGNMAVGFSVSSSTTFPSIRYAGRLASDPGGTLAQGEAVLQAGGGSQTSSTGRWGDYSMLAVDPVDDCTFWYTTEYYSMTSSSGWQTRIGKFGFPTCSSSTSGSAADLSIIKTGNPNPVTVGNNLTYTVTVTNNGPDTATGVALTDTLPSGISLFSVKTSQGSCSGTSTVNCNIGTLNNGSSATVTIVVTTTKTGTLSNTASVTANESDPDTANNTSTVNTTVNALTAGSCVGTGSFNISGSVLFRISGAALKLGGPGGCTNTTTTSRVGTYQFLNLTNGIYILTPSKTGCTFTPSSQTVTISGSNKTANFTGKCGF